MMLSSSQTAPIHLSVVVPIYNEQLLLMEMAQQLAAHLDEIAGPGRWQFVLVDNGSRDGSTQVCDEIVSRWPQSESLRAEKPRDMSIRQAGSRRHRSRDTSRRSCAATHSTDDGSATQ